MTTPSSPTPVHLDTLADGGPAFPTSIHPDSHDGAGMSGMNLRDYFAGKFLAGAATDASALDVSVAADQFDVDAALRNHWGQVARAAYIAADAMLAARHLSEVGGRHG